MIAGEGCKGRLERDGTGTGAAFVEGGQVHAPGLCRLGAVRACQSHLHKLFCFGEGRRRDFICVILCAAARGDGCADKTERSLCQEMPARFGHGSSAQHCSRVLRPEKMESLSCRAGWLANRKWSTGNCALAYDGARLGLPGQGPYWGIRR